MFNCFSELCHARVEPARYTKTQVQTYFIKCIKLSYNILKN